MKSGQIIIFLGPPGAGKGTQASRLSAEFGIPAISTGDMLRRECQSGSKLGRTIEQVLASGELVGDDLVNRVVAARLRHFDCRRGCILDGYPRTLSQAVFLNSLVARMNLPLPVIFDFDLDPHDVIARLARRRQCAVCGRAVSVDPNAPKGELFCDRDGAPLVQRNDDTPAVIHERLRQYRHNTGELVRFYSGANYHRLVATGTPDQVSETLFATCDSGMDPATFSASMPSAANL